MRQTVGVVLLLAGALLLCGRAIAQTNEDLTLTADFAQRDALPQSPVPVSEWATLKGWGPTASAYPLAEVPQGRDPLKWKRARVLAVALKYIGLPYRHHHVPGWAPAGSADPKEAGNGLDCSNFSAWIYNYGLGIKFTSEIGKQSQGAGAPGRLLAAGEAFEPGDLLFILKGDRTCISHVVIYMDEPRIIDARADGVAVRAFKGWYRTHLSHARRVLE